MSLQIATFRARTLAEALRLVRDTLGPDAALLATREVGSPLARLLGAQAIEVTASTHAVVPSRLPLIASAPKPPRSIVAAELQDFRQRMRQNLRLAGRFEDSLVERLASQPPPTSRLD